MKSLLTLAVLIAGLAALGSVAVTLVLVRLRLDRRLF